MPNVGYGCRQPRGQNGVDDLRRQAVKEVAEETADDTQARAALALQKVRDAGIGLL